MLTEKERNSTPRNLSYTRWPKASVPLTSKRRNLRTMSWKLSMAVWPRYGQITRDIKATRDIYAALPGTVRAGQGRSPARRWRKCVLGLDWGICEASLSPVWALGGRSPAISAGSSSLFQRHERRGRGNEDPYIIPHSSYLTRPVCHVRLDAILLQVELDCT